MTQCKHENISEYTVIEDHLTKLPAHKMAESLQVGSPMMERRFRCIDCGKAVRSQDERLENIEIKMSDCKHPNIEIRPRLIEIPDASPTRSEWNVASSGMAHLMEKEFFCVDCGLVGDSEDDIRGEGSIEAAIEQESDERERKLNELHATLASTPEALLAQIDEKMFRQIMNGYITVKLRPHDTIIGYYILSAQDRDLAFVPDPEEGCRFIAAIFLKAAHVIPKLRRLDEDAKGRSLILTNGNGLKLIQ